MSPRPIAGRLRPLLLVIAALAIIAAAYTGYWWLLRRELLGGIADWSDAQRAAGWDIRHGVVESDGFPGTLRIRYPEPSIAAPPAQGAWRWQADVLELVLDPWSPWRFRAAAPGRHVIQTMGPRATTTITFAALRLQVGLLADPLDVEISARGVTAEAASGGELRIAHLSVRARPPETEVAPGDVLVSANGEDVLLPPEMPRPLGPSVRSIRLRTHVVDAAVLGESPERILTWRDAGGYLRVRELAVDYGPLEGRAQGRMALDDDGQPAGKLEARIAGAVETVDVLAASGLIQRDAAFGARIVLSMMQARPQDGGPPVVSMPVELERRVLRVGPFALFEVLPILWPVDPRPTIPALPGPGDSG